MHNVILEDDGVHRIAEKLKEIRMTLEVSLKDQGMQDKTKELSNVAALKRRKIKQNKVNPLL